MKRYYGTLDRDALAKQMKLNSIPSYQELAEKAGLHRNSLSPYLNQEKSAYTNVFLKLCEALSVRPESLIKENLDLDRYGLFTILKQLWKSKPEYADYCCFLFGSRAKDLAKKFSDYDIGLSLGVAEPRVFEFLDIKEDILTVVDDLPVSVDILDFDSAPLDFLANTGQEIRFICGSQDAFIQLLGKINGIRKTFENQACA